MFWDCRIIVNGKHPEANLLTIGRQWHFYSIRRSYYPDNDVSSWELRYSKHKLIACGLMPLYLVGVFHEKPNEKD